MSNSRIFICDFETTVFKGQESTEVWASAVVEIGTENVHIFHSIEQTLDYFQLLDCNCVLYYHNLKFDGEFWLYYLLKQKGFQQACIVDNEKPENTKWLERKDMPENSVAYRISSRGQWYSITIRLENHYLEIRDSLKLLPFSVKRIGKSFKTKHQKLEMVYEGKRYAGCPISEEEKQYIRNDVLVVKEALEFMFSEGHNKLTIGACCLSEYKKILGKNLFKAMFPNLKEEYPLDKEIYGAENADEYIRKSYKGGWCYAVKHKTNKRVKNGLTADVNSLYPSMMSSESGNRFPVGYPRFWKGEIPDKAWDKNRYFFVRIKTRFYLKKGKLPFIQIKGNLLYNRNESLETSDWYNRKTGTYHRYLYDEDNNKIAVRPELTLTCTDYKLFLEHYDVEDFEILDGCWFNTDIGIFDEYIERYKKIKLESTGAMRELAKLFLNNLYGKLATNDNSGFKLAYDKNEDEIGFVPIIQHEKPIVYIPCGSAITSYARNFTIRAAQANYYGKNRRGFIYADTDSIHCDLKQEELKGIKIHDKNFCCWKVESLWDVGIFARQKTYIEHVVAEDLKPIDNPYYNIKCAGMPDKCKSLFEASLSNRQFTNEEKLKMTDAEIDFLFDDDGNTKQRTLEDFKIGLRIPSKLVPKRIKGGVILTDSEYTMRPKF